MTAHGDKDLGQPRLRPRLDVGRHQAITCTNADLLLVRSSDIYPTAVSPAATDPKIRKLSNSTHILFKSADVNEFRALTCSGSSDHISSLRRRSHKLLISSVLWYTLGYMCLTQIFHHHTEMRGALNTNAWGFIQMVSVIHGTGCFEYCADTSNDSAIRKRGQILFEHDPSLKRKRRNYFLTSCCIVCPIWRLSRDAQRFNSHPDSMVHGANMRPIWGRQDPGGPHVDPKSFAIWALIVRMDMSIRYHPATNVVFDDALRVTTYQ